MAQPPLHLTWLDFKSYDERGSYAAVCSMLPHIEIFDLDRCLDLRAAVILGGPIDRENLYNPPDQGGSWRSGLMAGSHTQSVLCCDWNKNQRNVMATGSADTTVKLWDLETAECANTLRLHKSEVLRMKWHPQVFPLVLHGPASLGTAIPHPPTSPCPRNIPAPPQYTQSHRTTHSLDARHHRTHPS